jgi:hypothetical protein
VAVGAFMGFEAAHQQLRKEVMDTAFYDNGGIKIAEFVTAVESAISPINEQSAAILDMKSSIDQSVASYDTAYVEIGSLIGQLQYMGTVTEESVNKILTASQNLYNQSSTIFNDQQTMLQTYLIDMMERAGETSKSVYGGMLDDLYLFQASRTST